jgi:hypothetical protein
MPSVSKSQQKLFGMIHAYQKGKIPADKVSPKIKKMAKTISPEDVVKYASTTHKGLDEILQDIYNSPAYIEETIREINETQIPAEIKGELIDIYTAGMLSMVTENLTSNKKQELLSLPVHKMVALAYKMLTY